MENDQDGANISRGQNQLHLLPEDWHSVAGALEPLLERLEAEAAAPQLLVLTSDSEAAAGLAARIASAIVQRGLRILAATDARRATRVQRSAAAHVLVGPPNVLMQMLQSSVLKLDVVRAAVLVSVDELDQDAVAALETVMSEVPKDAARVVIASALTPTVEQLLERYARRARRVQPVTPEATVPSSLSYVSTGESTRIPTLRRLLDALDAESAFVVTRSPDSRAAVELLLLSLGYDAEAGAVRTGETPAADAQLIVLFDIPASAEELRRVVGDRASARVIALVTPRQISALRRFAGGTVSPLVLPEAAVRARSREEGLRDELRAVLVGGQFARELLAVEPLLSEFDGSEVAAAALRLLEVERLKPATPAPAAATPMAPMTRLYLNVGSMDNVRPGDLVGAITNEAGIAKAELGKVDVRERHSTVEVATPVANSVVSKITGVSIRGRRVIARVDEGPERPARPRRDDVRLGSHDSRRDRGAGRPPRDRDRNRPPRDPR